MRPIFLPLFLSVSFSCLACTYTCKPPTPPSSIAPPSHPLPKENYKAEPPPSNLPENQTQPTPAPSVSTFWSVSEVDISHIDPARKLIAFTFDDAPAQTMESIFTVFADYNEHNPDCLASATVFFNSCRFDRQTPHLLAACLALGMELGNHTHAHQDLTTLNERELRKEIDRTDSALFDIDGKERHLLRAPFGKTNALVKSVADAPLIDWTIDTLDWSGVSAEEIYQTVFTQRFDGAIVLMHDGYKNTVEALKGLLPDLKRAGYQVVTVSQLAKMHNCAMRHGNTYIRLRKQK